MPGRDTTTGTFPINVVLEKDLLGGDDLGAVGTGFGGMIDVSADVVEGFETDGSSPATVS